MEIKAYIFVTNLVKKLIIFQNLANAPILYFFGKNKELDKEKIKNKEFPKKFFRI